jgi:hypothetical protein
MRACAIYLAQRFIGEGAGLILKKYALFRQHREASEAIGALLTIQRDINPTEFRAKDRTCRTSGGSRE